MRRALVGAAAVAALAAAGAALWFTRDRGTAATTVEPGQPLPYDTTVELRFPADENGEQETWVVSKRRTTREQSLHGEDGSHALPSPSPADPDRAVVESARVLDDLARDAWRGGDLERALELFAQAVEADPDDWVAHAHYGRLLAVAQDRARARPLLERAAALAPDDPQRWLDLQTLYEQSLDLDLALEARARAETLAGGRPIAKDWAGFWTIDGAEDLP